MSKYIDADRLKAEIERRKEKWLAASRFIKKGRDQAMYAAGKSSAYTEFLSLVTPLQQEQPELPSNLDEAAEDSWAVYEYRESPKGLYSTCYVDGFKAGAEWMAGQGETFNGYISMKGKRSLIAIEGKSDIHKFGDKVIVQIRKK